MAAFNHRSDRDGALIHDEQIAREQIACRAQAATETGCGERKVSQLFGFGVLADSIFVAKVVRCERFKSASYYHNPFSKARLRPNARSTLAQTV